VLLTRFVGVDCVLQVGYRRHSRMTEHRQVLPLQFRYKAGLMLCNWQFNLHRFNLP